MGNARVGQGAEDGQGLFTVVSMERKDQNLGLGLAHLNNFSGLWGVATFSGCLVSRPGWLGWGSIGSDQAQVVAQLWALGW